MKGPKFLRKIQPHWMEAAWEEMSRMTFAPWSRAQSYLIWKPLDFHLQITCLRTGLTACNSFCPTHEKRKWRKLLWKNRCHPHKAQEPRLSLLPWMGGSVPSYPGFLTSVPSLSSSSSENLHSSTGITLPWKEDYPQAGQLAHMLPLPPRLPPQRNKGIHCWFEEEKVVHCLFLTISQRSNLRTTSKNVLSVISSRLRQYNSTHVSFKVMMTLSML